MESDNEQTENTELIVPERLAQKRKADYVDSDNDCLTDAFVSMYKSSIWCLQSIYELLFRSLAQVFLVSKAEVCHDRIDRQDIKRIDMLSINNSAGERFHRHRLSRSRSHHSRECRDASSTLLSSKTRVTVRSVSNLNLNRAPSEHGSTSAQKRPSRTLGTINSHIVVMPVDSSHCQNQTSKNDLPSAHTHFQQLEKIRSREQLADALCRRSHELASSMYRGMCCGHCRPMCFPYMSYQQPNAYIPPAIAHMQATDDRGLSAKTTKLSDASDAQSTPYSVSPSIQSHPIHSPEGDDPLTTGTKFHPDTNDQNQSILSFPDHDTPLSQQSEELIGDDSQLRLDAQVFVNDSIQIAQEKYQRILQMSVDQDSAKHPSDAHKEATKNQSKSVHISDKSRRPNLSDSGTLCEQLCSKLNLSNANQITEVVRLLATNAPHILKEQPAHHTRGNTHTDAERDHQHLLSSQLLLHPPFKPKRLIHLAVDGTIQVLSAVDSSASSDHQPANQQQYKLNYSNSAITSSIPQTHLLTNDSSLALEYETTTVDLQTGFHQRTTAELIATPETAMTNKICLDESALLSLQRKKTLVKYDHLWNYQSAPAKELALHRDSVQAVSEGNGPVVEIDLHLNDESMEIQNGNDDSSLPEIVFKRIIAPGNCTARNAQTSYFHETDEPKRTRRKNHSKSRTHRRRSSSNGRTVPIEGDMPENERHV